MPVVIASKSRFYGTVTPPALNTETTVVEIGAQSDDYIVEGYIDVSQLQSGDALEIREYIAVDGTNYQLFLHTTLSGSISEPVIRFHAKTLIFLMKYKLTIAQTSGTPRSFPYGFVLEVLGTA
jgi:hypothetical protein